MFFMPDKADERILQPCSLANAGSQTSIVFAMPDQDPRLLEMRGLPPAAVAAPLFELAKMERRYATHAMLRNCSMQSVSALLLPVQLA